MSELENKKTIGFMPYFANLFLALYSLEFENEDEKVYFSREFKNIFETTINSIDLHLCSEYSELFDIDDFSFKIDEFLRDLRISTTKKYWSDNFKFDFEKNSIYTTVEKKQAKSIVSEYTTKDIKIMDRIVNKYKEYQYKFETEGEYISSDNNENVGKRNYTILSLKSND